MCVGGCAKVYKVCCSMYHRIRCVVVCTKASGV